MKVTRKQMEILRPYIPDLERIVAEDDYYEFAIAILDAYDVISDERGGKDEWSSTHRLVEQTYYEILSKNKPKKSFFSRLFKKKTGD